GAGLNCLLIYLVLRFSRKSLGSYKQLLAIFAAYDVYLCVLHAVVKPKVLIVGTTFGVVGTHDSKVSISIFSASFTVPFTLMIIDFLYR
ncbi:hypothetical protein PMAYCL1PPCAC_14790, partial [Pristionchus mayeri]